MLGDKSQLFAIGGGEGGGVCALEVWLRKESEVEVFFGGKKVLGVWTGEAQPGRRKKTQAR